MLLYWARQFSLIFHIHQNSFDCMLLLSKWVWWCFPLIYSCFTETNTFRCIIIRLIHFSPFSVVLFTNILVHVSIPATQQSLLTTFKYIHTPSSSAELQVVGTSNSSSESNHLIFSADDLTPNLIKSCGLTSLRSFWHAQTALEPRAFSLQTIVSPVLDYPQLWLLRRVHHTMSPPVESPNSLKHCLAIIAHGTWVNDALVTAAAQGNRQGMTCH